MLETFNRMEWREDTADVIARNGLSVLDKPETLRKLYPYKGRVLDCHSTTHLIYGIKPGDEIPYVRTKHEPGIFPVEAVLIMDGGVVAGTEMGQVLRRMFFRSGELQVFEP